MKLSQYLWLAVAGAAVSPQTFAEAPSSETSYLDEIIVTATRQEERIFDVPVSVSVINQEDIQRTETSSFRELFRYTPGVDVIRDRRSRAGEANVQIRGLGGRRVLMLVDGVRLPDGFGAAGVSDQSRGKLEMESLGRVEVVRGPNSSLYGSDALGGIVAFQTKRPDTILGGEREFGTAFGAGYDSAIESTFGVADLAWRSGDIAGLLNVTYRDRSELENNSSNGPDPQDIDARNVLTKVEWTPGSDHLVTFTGEWFRTDSETDRESANVAVGPPPIRIFDNTFADDHSERQRFGVAWRWTPADNSWLTDAHAQVDYQDSETFEEGEFTVTTVGAGPPSIVQRTDELDYRQEQWSSTGQLSLQMPDTEWLSAIVGYEWVRRDTSQRDFETQTGIAPPTPLTTIVEGNVYPQKLYPDTRSDLIGTYAQLKLELLDGRLTILPSVRYDSYELDPQPDSLFDNANVLGFTPASLDEDEVTPRIGATWHVSESVSLFANYAQGFRTPGAEQLNRIGRVPVATFVHDFLPNPGLDPETSEGFEVGIRGRWKAFSGELSTYDTDYEDFINTALTAFIPAGVIGNPLTIRQFQSVNIDEVRIRGVEGRASIDLGELSGSLDGFRVRMVFNYTDGDNETDDQPLNSVPPTQLILGAQYQSPDDRWGVELYGTLVDEKDDVAPISSRGVIVDHITQDSYTTWDLSFNVRLFNSVRLNLQATNIFDEEYAEWPDLVNLPAGAPQEDYFSAPGLAFAASLRTEF